MSLVTDSAERQAHHPTLLPAEDMKKRVQSVLRHAVTAYQEDNRVYESLRNLNEVVGTEYGDRVLYELIQNAHDAHQAEDQGRIAVRLVVHGDTDGSLYIANGGAGFRKEDVDAIRNLATTSKEVGEGIGNKGLGFRSIEALTDDVRIFSHWGRSDSDYFDGYCFRFAAIDEIEDLLRKDGVEAVTAREAAKTIPRYLVPLPLTEQPDDVVSFARRGYATVIVAPLHTAAAIELAKRKVRELADLTVPLLLFLDRIAEFRIDIETRDAPVHRRRLSRRQTALGGVPSLAGCLLHEVRVGDNRRFLVVQREVDKARVLEAIERSISRAPQLRRWLDWKGQPTVSVAVGLSPAAVDSGRVYNFLPMGDEAVAPLLGHLDAPFFAEIDRRNADFNLPLNAMFMTAAAEACAHAARYIAGQADTPIPQRAVFDLVSWTGEHARKLDTAFSGMGSPLAQVPIVPMIAVDGARWASLSAINAWPEGSFSLMKAEEVAKRTSARLVSRALDGPRLGRLKAIAKRQYPYRHPPLMPSGVRLAEWSERFARSLADRSAAPRTWSRFYEDLNRVFDAADEELSALAGKSIIFDRSQKLHRAGTNIFVRSEASRRRRARDDVPLPTKGLSRRYRFLDNKIKLQPDTVSAFIKAGLARQYDPVEALAELEAVLGAKASDNRRQEALAWAFSVWRAIGASASIQKALRSAKLRVPTASGWRLATRVAFSSSWTPVGQTLENFLVEATDKSPDCQRARDALLVNFDKWPLNPVGTKRLWVEFLNLLGVADGLIPVAGRLQESGLGSSWNHLVRTENAKEALGRDWCNEASRKSFRHPYTMYRRRGAAWRLPGQIEHDELPDTAKEAFQELAFRHLETHNSGYLTFEVGRFERPERDQNRQTLPTPLATFLRTTAWIAVSTHEKPVFRIARECWATRTRRPRLPRFMECMSDTIASLVESSGELADLVFGSAVGLRDWNSKDTAAERLSALAIVAPDLALHERRDFHKEYRRAWLEVSDTNAELPRSLDLAVTRNGRLERLCGDPETTPAVIVGGDAQAFEARILSSAGYALLDIGEASNEEVVECLAATGVFAPRPLDGTGVRLLVDGDPFVPKTSDSLLCSGELAWLPEVVVLGHEILAQELERGVQRDTVERGIRAIRVRRCRTVTLVVDERNDAPQSTMAWHSFDHPELPTLILSDDVQLTWRTLSRDFSRPISRLIDSRLRFLEALLLRLAQDRDTNELGVPSDEALAAALGCDAQMLHEHRAALQTDIGHILHLLAPVVAYFGGVALARQLKDDAESAREVFDVLRWLRLRFHYAGLAPEDLIDACERTVDRAALRKELDLDYGQFNRVLLALGEPLLSNEVELRSIYDAYIRQMSSHILERLRRHHATDFREGRNLTPYVTRKAFAFLEFDPAWVLTKETLDSETVEAHVARLLDSEFGQDKQVDLPPLSGLVRRNRKSVHDFASRAVPIVGAWCSRNLCPVPESWRIEDPQAITRHLEDAGLLDFEPVEEHQMPALCHRARCWPGGMPQTLDLAALGLDQVAVEDERKNNEKERQRRVIEERSIDFAGARLDTGDPSFAEAFQRLAEKSVESDGRWFDRSRRPRLAELPETGDRLPGGRTGGGGGNGRRRKNAPEHLRQAMGLASEWLAFQFLRRQHSEAVDETCWVSTNRSHFFGGDEGDDSAGYDFCVKTPQAEWLYEVKSSLENAGEFELTPNEMRVAASIPRYGRRRYRILYVPFVFSPDRWMVLELPNPMGEGTRNRFKQIGRSSVRFRFEASAIATA